MTRAELREKVARKVRSLIAPQHPQQVNDIASVAIDIVLEEAARVAAGTASYDDAVQKSAGCHTTGQRIAAAIRAMKGESGRLCDQ